MSLPLTHPQIAQVSRLVRVAPGSNALALRAALLVGCLFAVALAVAAHGDYARPDLELARLLRGMAAIKAGIVAVVIGLLIWRFGWPVSPGLAAVYLGGTWLAAGATALIWQLALLPVAAVAFHVAALAVAVAVWRDGSVSSGEKAP